MPPKLMIIFAIVLLVLGCATTGSKQSKTTTNSIPSTTTTNSTPSTSAIESRTIILDGTEINESENSEFISWICREYPSGYKTLFEVGRWSLKIPEEISEKGLQDSQDSGELSDEGKEELTKIIKAISDLAGMQGFILFDGTNEGERTKYHREGLNQRWDWGELEGREASRYSVIIKPDGTGLFYDFNTAVDGTKEKADDIFRCHRVD